jgi:hypothetical protein
MKCIEPKCKKEATEVIEINEAIFPVCAKHKASHDKFEKDYNEKTK